VKRRAYLLTIPSGISVPLLRVDPIWNARRGEPSVQRLIATERQCRLGLRRGIHVTIFHSPGDWRARVTRTPPEILQGTVDILILRTLAWQSMHGYAISHWIAERTDGVLTVDGAALYQALHRLENRKLLSASWGLSDNNRKAKYYTLTAAGRTRLKSEAAVWNRYADAVAKVLSPG